MSLQIRKVTMPSAKFSVKCPNALTPNGIVIHNTANDASAAGEISYMQTSKEYTSFHFAVDDIEAVQGVDLKRNTWHAGDGTGTNSANRTKLSIEICHSKSGGTKFTKAEQNAAKLAAMLCKEHNWGVDRITKHKDYKATQCPHRTVQLGWSRFIAMVQKELDALNSVGSGGNDGEVDELLEEIRLKDAEIAALEDKLDRIITIAK